MIGATVRRLPPGILPTVEQAAQLGQGKGWGASTVRDEVKAALSLLPMSQHARAVDVGANVGDWTAALITERPNATVTAVEPSSQAFASLSTRFNGVDAVNLENTALGSELGTTATLWADSPGSGLGSLEKRRLDHFGLEFKHSEEVSLTTLDDLLEGVQPDILKLDVEGRELDVLNGATSTIAGVSVIQFEFGGCNIDTRSYFQDFWYALSAEGFEIWRLGPHGLRRVANYSESDEVFMTTNFFASRSVD